MNHCRLVAVIFIAAIVCLITPSGVAQSVREQSFSIDGEMGQTVTIPKKVMQLLQAHPQVKEYASNPENDKKEMLEAFEAAPVDLARRGKVDLVVTNVVLNGANTGPFWVFIKTTRGYKQVLFVTSLDLTIRRARTKGLRDISAGTATAMSTSEDYYRFNGRRYRFAFTRNRN